jgi:hypothetical protein
MTGATERAAMLESHLLRSLDALHLSAALEIGDELDAVLMYDQRLATRSCSFHVSAG